MRVGVIGLGGFGQHHARHLAARDDADLAAVCDLDGDIATATARRHSCEVAATPEALADMVDAAVVATPATTHHAVTGPLLDKGRHVLVEKPLATTRDDAADLVERAGTGSAVLQVGHVERFSPAIQRLKDLVNAPRRISAVRYALWSGRSDDVDVVLDLMIHDIDHALTIAGAPVKEVAASGLAGPSNRIDAAEAWLTFDNGVVATLSASRIAVTPERRVTVTEFDRGFAADLLQPSLAMTTRLTAADRQAVPLDKTDILGDEIAAFVASAGGDAPVQVDGAAGMAALDVALRIQAALAETAAL